MKQSFSLNIPITQMALASQRSKAVFFSLVLIWYSSRAYYVFFFSSYLIVFVFATKAHFY